MVEPVSRFARVYHDFETLLPRPVKLRLHLAEPFWAPPIASELPREDQVEAFRVEVHERMRAWVRRCAIADGHSITDPTAAGADPRSPA